MVVLDIISKSESKTQMLQREMILFHYALDYVVLYCVYVSVNVVLFSMQIFNPMCHFMIEQFKNHGFVPVVYASHRVLPALKSR